MTTSLNFDAVLRSACQALESYDVQEFISYLSHSTWQVLTDKEYHDAERKRSKDQKWFFLRDLLKKNPDRIAQFIVVSQQFLANVHAEANCGLSRLSKAISQTNSSSSHLHQQRSQSHKWTNDHGEAASLLTSDDMDLEHSPDPLEMSQVSPEEEPLEDKVHVGETDLDVEDAGYGTLQSGSANQSLDAFSVPATSKHPPLVDPRGGAYYTHVAPELYRNQRKKRHPDNGTDLSARHQPAVQVTHNHFYFNSSNMTRSSLHTDDQAFTRLSVEEQTIDPPTSSDSDEELERLSQAKFEKKKRILEKYTKHLTQSMDVPTLLPFLQKRRLVSSRDTDFLLTTDAPDQDKNMHILRQLPKKGRDFFERFVQCLKDASDHSGHADLVDLLEKKYTKRCNSYK